MNDWKIWEQRKLDGEMHYRRAVGEAEEMESSKSVSTLIREFYEPGSTLLDVGCGGGHYLRSLRERVDPDIAYTGVDATAGYIELARKAYGDRSLFQVGDALALDFADGEFDIVMCNNLVLHLPPPPLKVLSELIRVARSRAVVRTLFGRRNYIIRQIYEADEVDSADFGDADLIADGGSARTGNYYNIYTEKYLRALIGQIGPKLRVEVRADDSWESFDNRKTGGRTGTEIINGMQVSGNLILDWRFIVITKDGS